MVFSTKHRAPAIPDQVEARLYAYLGGIVNDLGGRLLTIGGMADHVHLIIRDSKAVSDVQMIKDLKGSSSKWMNENAEMTGKFAWQSGYGWFSLSPKSVDAARAYVLGQREHHRTVTFQDEFRKFLQQYGIEYDERYVWD